MNVPSGYTALDLIGFTDRGDYVSTDNYVKNDLVHYNGRVWKCLIDDTTGITPVEGANWTVWIDEAAYLSGLADVTITNPANGQVIRYNSQSGKWENVGVDSTPTSGSANLVQSGGVATQLANKANSADLATVATSGDYQDLNNLPTLADVATTGQYSDLLGLPTIPTVNNGTLTLQINGVTVETFNANDSNNKTANFNVPTKTSDLTNDSNFVSDANYQHITVDSAFSDTSTNPVQNKVVNSLKETLTQQINVNGSKNILPIKLQKFSHTSGTNTKVIINNGDGSFHVTSNDTTGTAETAWFASPNGIFGYWKVDDYLDRTKQYVASITGNANNVRIYGRFYDANRVGIDSVIDVHTNAIVTIPDNAVYFMWGVRLGNSVNDADVYPMFCLKSDWDLDSSWAPPASPNKALFKETTGLIDNQNVNGAVNIAPCTATSQVITKGTDVTFVVNDDGSITENSSAATTGDINFVTGRFTLKKGCTYRVSDTKNGKKYNSASNSVFVSHGSTGIWMFTTKKGTTLSDVYTPSEDVVVNIGIQITSDEGAISNKTIYPMITVASYDGDYVPYAKSNKKLTDDVEPLLPISTYGFDVVTFALNWDGGIDAHGKSLGITSSTTIEQLIMNILTRGQYGSYSHRNNARAIIFSNSGSHTNAGCPAIYTELYNIFGAVIETKLLTIIVDASDRSSKRAYITVYVNANKILRTYYSYNSTTGAWVAGTVYGIDLVAQS